MKHVTMQRFHITLWNDKFKVFQEGRNAVQDYLGTGRHHVENNTVQLLAFLLDVDRRWTARELAADVGMSQNCASDSARNSGLPLSCSVLDTP